MNPYPSVSYDLAQARIADLRDQARRAGLARAAARSAQPAQPDRPRVPGRFRFVHRHRAAAAAS
jgi:hypothetical protein